MKLNILNGLSMYRKADNLVLREIRLVVQCFSYIHDENKLRNYSIPIAGDFYCLKRNGRSESLLTKLDEIKLGLYIL